MFLVFWVSSLPSKESFFSSNFFLFLLLIPFFFKLTSLVHSICLSRLRGSQFNWYFCCGVHPMLFLLLFSLSESFKGILKILFFAFNISRIFRIEGFWVAAILLGFLLAFSSCSCLGLLLMLLLLSS